MTRPMSEREFNTRLLASQLLAYLSGLAISVSIICTLTAKTEAALGSAITAISLVFVYASNTTVLMAKAMDDDQTKIRNRLARLENR